MQEPLPRGDTRSHDPLFLGDFIPYSPLIEPLVPKNVFSSCSLDPKIFCAVPLIPKNVYHCSPYLSACYTFLFKVEKKSLLNASFFSVECAHTVLHGLPFLPSPGGYSKKYWVGVCGLLAKPFPIYDVNKTSKPYL